MSDDLIVLNDYLLLGAALFTLGLVGFLARRHMVGMFVCAQMMLQGVLLTLVAFSTFHQTWNGRVGALLGLGVATMQAVIGIALCIAMFGREKSLDVSIWQDLHEAEEAPSNEGVSASHNQAKHPV